MPKPTSISEMCGFLKAVLDTEIKPAALQQQPAIKHEEPALAPKVAE